MDISIDQINNLPFGRAYKITKGDQVQFVPSVTTILKMNPDPFIDNLLLEMGPEKFKELQEKGADRGTVMHKWMEVFLDEFGKDRDVSRSLLFTQKYISETKEFENLPSDLSRALKIGRELFYNFYNSGFHNKIAKVLHNEIFLHTFFKGGWAGACDFVYEDHDGKLVILDFKSSSIPKDPDKIDNYKMQICCYMFKYAEMFGRMPDRGEIVISNEATSDLQWVTVPGDEMKIHLRKFLNLLSEFRKLPEWIEFNNTHNVRTF